MDGRYGRAYADEAVSRKILMLQCMYLQLLGRVRERVRANRAGQHPVTWLLASMAILRIFSLLI